MMMMMEDDLVFDDEDMELFFVCSFNKCILVLRVN